MADLAHSLFPRHFYGDVDKIAHDRVHFATNIANFRELGGFYLDKRRLSQLGKSARNFRFADAGRTNHQNVLGRDLAAQRLIDLHTSPAVAQRDSDRSLGFVLANDVLVQLLDYFSGRHLGHDLVPVHALAESSSTTML